MKGGVTRAPDMPAPVEEPWPAIVLVRPQMGENIGAVARAMLNFGLTGLRLVEPRDRWPNPKAHAVAAGADKVLEAAQVEWTLEAALADCSYVLAATARPRELEIPVLAPRAAAEELRAAVLAGAKPAVLFGAEAGGLTNEEVARANAIMTYPVNPGFPSLNLAQSVALFSFCYGETRAGGAVPAWFADPLSAPASHGEMEDLFAHLETELVRGRFFHPPEKGELMRQYIRALFLRARPSVQEARTLRGMVKALTIGRGGRKLPEVE
jgi:tRNA/rRNA methyltransferase